MLVPVPEEDEPVTYLFLDLNSYFASVEQQERPELRAKPVAVVPVRAETTCCIAASYEAKAYGVRTGTGVRDVKRLCPQIILIEARPELYVEYHHKITAAVESVLPITCKPSIDEMACRLMGRERPLKNALRIGGEIKRAIRVKAGETLRCSIGLAPNQMLAKMASNLQKPDGLSSILLSQLPGCLYPLNPSDVPGIGTRMGRRLEQEGIFTMEQLCSLSEGQMRNIWGSVVGKRYWHWLRGEDFDGQASQPPQSVGHQHVLAPEFRTMQQACLVGQKLLHRSAARLRRIGMWARGLSVYISFSPRGEKRVWECHTRILESQDTITLQEIFLKMWSGSPQGKPNFVGVCLYDLVPDTMHTESFLEEEQRRGRLSKIMDSLNLKYGNDVLCVGGLHQVREAAPTRIAFSSIPEFHSPSKLNRSRPTLTKSLAQD